MPYVAALFFFLLQVKATEVESSKDNLVQGLLFLNEPGFRHRGWLKSLLLTILCSVY